MRWKNMEGHNTCALFARGCSQERNRSNFSSGRSKYKGRSKSTRKFVRVCWRCGKEGNYKKQCRSKVEKKKRYEESSSTKEKTSKEGGDVYLASSSTHADHEAWLVDSGASFHMTPHREWFYEYEKYDFIKYLRNSSKAIQNVCWLIQLSSTSALARLMSR
jgi:hypothetical protein